MHAPITPKWIHVTAVRFSSLPIFPGIPLFKSEGLGCGRAEPRLSFVQGPNSIPVAVNVRAAQGAFWYTLLLLLRLVQVALFVVVLQRRKLLRNDAKH